MKESIWRTVRVLAGSFLLTALALSAARASDARDPDLDRKIDSLIQVFADPQAGSEKVEDSRKAIDALAAIGKPAVPKLIEAILDDRDSAIRYVSGYSAAALDKIGPAAVDQVRAKWKDLGEADRWKLMRFRGKYDYEGSLEFALTSLRSKDIGVRGQAMEYLCQHKESRAKADLLNAFQTDTPSFRWYLIGGLEACCGEEAIDAYIPLLSPDSWLSKGEGGPKPDGGVPPWWPDGRPRVIEALGRMKAKRAAPALLKVLQEKGPGRAYLGSFILPLLAEFGHTESIPELRRILANDPEALAAEERPKKPYVQVLAARALWQLGDHSGRLPLLHLVADSSGRGKRLACPIIAQLGDQGDIWILAGCLDDPDEDVRAAACQGLERITGVVNRAPERVASSARDAPLWEAWYRKYQAELARTKGPTGAANRPQEGGAQAGKLSAGELEQLWADLGTGDAPKAYGAVWRAVEAGEQAVRFLQQRLQPAPSADPEHVTRLIADLNDDQFAVRHKAAQELESLGAVAESALRKALEGQPPAEVRRQVKRLLEALKPLGSHEALRTLCALEVLEQIGSAEARQILRMLTEGEPQAWLTQEAKVSLDRLAKPPPTRH